MSNNLGQKAPTMNSRSYLPSGPSATLAALPFELKIHILSCGILSREDWANTRLLCRSFEQPAASLLFERIIFSRLRQDLATFLAISRTPCLAKHVRQLVWQELNLEACGWREEDDTNDWTLINQTPAARQQMEEIGYDDTVAQLIIEALDDEELFWLPRRPDDPRLIHQQYLHELLASRTKHFFSAALSRLTNLTIFNSCPMPHHRILTYKGYPIQVDLFRSQSPVWVAHYNCGLFDYLFPAMGGIKSGKITTLHWTDESLMTSLSYLKPTDALLFSNLTSISLCISYVKDIENILHNIVTCLSAAKNLRRLSLCFEKVSSDHLHVVRLVHSIFRKCYWPKLTTLELTNLWLRRGEFMPFIQFLRRHCLELRHLKLIRCNLSSRRIVSMRNSHLRLDSITIESDTISDTDIHLHEQDVLLIINKKVDLGLVEAWIGNSHGSSHQNIMTRVSQSNHHEWHMEGFCGSETRHCEHLADEAVRAESTPIEEETDEEDGEVADFADSQPTVYWDWAEFGTGPELEVHSWVVRRASEAKTETKTWQFNHRDGRIAVGEDPLDYFSDWDDEEDAVIPMPFCQEFNTYLEERGIKMSKDAIFTAMPLN
ncbi:hypothetical protein M426DRAFT_17294 [Hypoxylon sp. CI-4A]|nr:hypothetical protein M426DRAFT_17294 [Hypoxylon sp. CI-4A]